LNSTTRNLKIWNNSQSFITFVIYPTANKYGTHGQDDAETYYNHIQLDTDYHNAKIFSILFYRNAACCTCNQSNTII